MAKWSGNKVNPEQINNGDEYTTNDNLSVEAVNSIVNNSINAQKNSEEALKKANSAYEANGTLVKINGVNQTEWDATFSQKLYEESVNLFGGNVETVNNLLFYNGTTVSRTDISDGIVYIPIKNNTNYAIRIFDYTGYTRKALFVKEPNVANVSYISSSYIDSISSLNQGITFNSGEANYLAFSDIAHSNFETFINNVVLVEGTTIPNENLEYNPKRHITNDEADFLKEEHEKQVNLYEVPNLYSQSANGLTWNVTNHLFNISGTSTAETSINLGDVPLEILKSGEQYKLYSSVTYDATNFNISIFLQYEDGSVDFITPNSNTTIKDNLTIARIALYCPSSGISYNYTNVGFMLLKAINNVSKYHPYNSNKHITNAQADFLKSEYDKSLNELDVDAYSYRYSSSLGLTNTFNKGSVTSSGTATADYGNFGRFKVHLKANTTYTISLVKNNDAFAWFRNSNEETVKTTVFRGTKNSETFTLTEDIYYIDIGWENLVVGTTYNLSMSEIMINKGPALPYQEWNGEIVHAGDIQNSQVEQVWSGSVYSSNSTLTIPNYNSSYLYLIEFFGFSSQWNTTRVLHVGQYGQYTIQGDNTQFCRYRLENNNGVITISPNGTTGNDSNTAIVGIYKVKGGTI